MKKIGRTIVASILASAMIVTPVFAEPTVGELKESVEEAEGQVSALQQELQELVAKMNQLEEDLIQKGEDIQEAETELVAAQETERKQYADMKLRIKYMYEESGGNVIETLLSATSFTDFINRAQYMSSIHTYDRKMLDEYTATRQQIEDLKAKLEKEQADMQTMQEEYRKEEDTLNANLNAKQAEVADLADQLQAAVEAEAERARQAEEARKKAEEEAQRQASAGAADNGNTAAVNTANGDTSIQSEPEYNEDDGGYTAPSNPGGGAAIVAAAQSWLGVPYVYGGSSRSGVDCSGLVMNVHAACGIYTARTSGAIGGGGKPVTDPLPGDVVCYAGHVGIYVGDGMMIHAPVPGDVVRYGSIDYAPHWFRRYW